MLEKLLNFILGPARKNSIKSELDLFIQSFEANRKTEPLSRKKEKARLATIFKKRDFAIRPCQKY